MTISAGLLSLLVSWMTHHEQCAVFFLFIFKTDLCKGVCMDLAHSISTPESPSLSSCLLLLLHLISCTMSTLHSEVISELTCIYVSPFCLCHSLASHFLSSYIISVLLSLLCFFTKNEPSVKEQ